MTAVRQGLRVTKQPTTNPKLVGDRRDLAWYATYRAVGYSCWTGCALLNDGCYAQHGNVNIHQRGAVSDADGEVFRREVARIPDGAVIRLHVSGDVMTNEGPNGSNVVDHDYLQAVVDTARARPNVTMYGYTHSWRMIDRKRYGAWPANLVLNASVDDPEDVPTARAMGWDTTTVVPSDTAGRRHGDTVICPAQTTEGMSCAACMLCAKPNRKLTVAFLAHGSGKRRVDERVSLPTV